jgi:signal transduction histidine kinase
MGRDPPRARSLQARIVAVMLLLALMTAFVLLLQAGLSQRLVVHPVWKSVLESSLQQSVQGGRLPPPGGALRGWRLHGDESPADMPAYLGRLAPGFYDERQLDDFDRSGSYAALVTATGEGEVRERIVLVIDLTEFEDEQNASVRASILAVLLNLALIVAVAWWLTRTLRRPVRELAKRLAALDPQQPAQRLPEQWPQDELSRIARGTNAHLARVERFIERERSLLDQASHEFRTPLAVVGGAADVLGKLPLPASAARPLQRIHDAVAQMKDTTQALLMLSREAGPSAADPASGPRPGAERCAMHDIVPAVMADQEYLVTGRAVCLVLESTVPVVLPARGVLVRILVGNLLRNAVAATQQGEVRVRLDSTRLVVSDPGHGFDTAEAEARDARARQDGAPPPGSGLGLFISRRICERFGWSLSFESGPNQGSIVTVLFDREA